MTIVTVYTKQSRDDNRAVCAMLIQLDIAHVCIDVEQNDEALARVKQLGYLQTPVVVTAHEHWLGHQPEKLAALIAQRK